MRLIQMVSTEWMHWIGQCCVSDVNVILNWCQSSNPSMRARVACQVCGELNIAHVDQVTEHRAACTIFGCDTLVLRSYSYVLALCKFIWRLEQPISPARLHCIISIKTVTSLDGTIRIILIAIFFVRSLQLLCRRQTCLTLHRLAEWVAILFFFRVARLVVVLFSDVSSAFFSCRSLVSARVTCAHCWQTWNA